MKDPQKIELGRPNHPYQDEAGGVWSVTWTFSREAGRPTMQDKIKADSEAQARKHLDFNMGCRNRSQEIEGRETRVTGYEIEKVESYDPAGRAEWQIGFGNGLDVWKYESIFNMLESEARDFAAGKLARLKRAPRSKYSRYTIKKVEK